MIMPDVLPQCSLGAAFRLLLQTGQCHTLSNIVATVVHLTLQLH
jgi:hypothetical protein